MRIDLYITRNLSLSLRLTDTHCWELLSKSLNNIFTRRRMEDYKVILLKLQLKGGLNYRDRILRCTTHTVTHTHRNKLLEYVIAKSSQSCKESAVRIKLNKPKGKNRIKNKKQTDNKNSTTKKQKTVHLHVQATP